MNSKERAKDLYDKFYSEFLQFDKGCDLSGRKEYAIRSSLICIKEMSKMNLLKSDHYSLDLIKGEIEKLK